jgi:hypothetical protein
MGLGATARIEPNSDMFERVRQAALAKAEEKVRSLRCPEHGEAVSLALEGSAVSVSGCCEAFRRRAAGVICGK